MSLFVASSSRPPPISPTGTSVIPNSHLNSASNPDTARPSSGLIEDTASEIVHRCLQQQTDSRLVFTWYDSNRNKGQTDILFQRLAYLIEAHKRKSFSYPAWQQALTDCKTLINEVFNEQEEHHRHLTNLFDILTTIFEIDLDEITLIESILNKISLDNNYWEELVNLANSKQFPPNSDVNLIAIAESAHQIRADLILFLNNVLARHHLIKLLDERPTILDDLIEKHRNNETTVLGGLETWLFDVYITVQEIVRPDNRLHQRVLTEQVKRLTNDRPEYNRQENGGDLETAYRWADSCLAHLKNVTQKRHTPVELFYAIKGHQLPSTQHPDPVSCNNHVTHHNLASQILFLHTSLSTKIDAIEVVTRSTKNFAFSVWQKSLEKCQNLITEILRKRKCDNRTCDQVEYNEADLSHNYLADPDLPYNYLTRLLDLSKTVFEGDLNNKEYIQSQISDIDRDSHFWINFLGNLDPLPYSFDELQYCANILAKTKQIRKNLVDFLQDTLHRLYLKDCLEAWNTEYSTLTEEQMPEWLNDVLITTRQITSGNGDVPSQPDLDSKIAAWKEQSTVLPDNAKDLLQQAILWGKECLCYIKNIRQNGEEGVNAPINFFRTLQLQS